MNPFEGERGEGLDKKAPHSLPWYVRTCKEISTRSQTDTKSTQTDTRSQTVVKQTSRSERTHIRLHADSGRTQTALTEFTNGHPGVSLTTDGRHGL